jgi:hypothetical protein
MQRHVWGPTCLVGELRIRHQGLCRVADRRAEVVRDGQPVACKGVFLRSSSAPGGTKPMRLAGTIKNESLSASNC